MGVWFGIGIFFLAVEFFTFGLISIWFAFGAFVAMLFTNLDITYQFYIFIVVSGLSLLLIRKTALKYTQRKSKVLDRVTGQIVKIEKVELRGEQRIYIVRLDGKYWEAKSEFTFEKDDVAKVEKIEGNKLCLIKE